jgi:hypothetical protein
MNPTAGPFLFEAEALGYLARTTDKTAARWFRRYTDLFPVCVSAATVMVQTRGYALLAERTEPDRFAAIAEAQSRYLDLIASPAIRVLPVGMAEAMVAAQIAVLVPFSPNPPRRSGAAAESRPNRLARWRGQILVAATALANNMPLVHASLQDFDAIRGLVERFPQRFPGVTPQPFVFVGQPATGQ